MDASTKVYKKPQQKNFGYTNQDEEKSIENKAFFTQVSEVDKKEKVLDAFSFFDSTGKGSISCREYYSILLGAGGLTEADIDLIFKESKLEIDGVVDYRKFVNFWENK
jgi:Ca2+-binding EF-hand superfamily protein